MSKENKKCPSYDGGYCNTAPFPYSVKCSDLNDCAWKDTEKFQKRYKEIYKSIGFDKAKEKEND